MADRVGQQLGNYTLTRLLGEGGFAEVYLGEHLYLKTQAAIKVLQTRLSAGDDMQSFLQEAQTIARLSHPNIIRVMDFGIAGDTPFLVMEYAPNGTLRQRHPRGQRVPLATILPYVKQIADALQYAHEEQHLIHRDIMPENMLLGRRGEVLLSDFGIALVAQSSRSQRTQEAIGTVAYMAPEQIQGKPRPASDQYSLAVVVYEWLTGDCPFRGTFTELCTQHMFAPPPPLSQKLGMVPPAVEQVITRALAKDPKQRFESIALFARALEQAAAAASPSYNTVQMPSGTAAPPSYNTVMMPPTTAVSSPFAPGQSGPSRGTGSAAAPNTPAPASLNQTVAAPQGLPLTPAQGGDTLIQHGGPAEPTLYSAPISAPQQGQQSFPQPPQRLVLPAGAPGFPGAQEDPLAATQLEPQAPYHQSGGSYPQQPYSPPAYNNTPYAAPQGYSGPQQQQQQYPYTPQPYPYHPGQPQQQGPYPQQPYPATAQGEQQGQKAGESLANWLGLSSIWTWQAIGAITGIVLMCILHNVQPQLFNHKFPLVLVIPLFFGGAFGPWVGLVVGGIGGLLCSQVFYAGHDALHLTLFTGASDARYVWWISPLIYVVAALATGLPMLIKLRRYPSIGTSIRSVIMAVVGLCIVCGYVLFRLQEFRHFFTTELIALITILVAAIVLVIYSVVARIVDPTS